MSSQAWMLRLSALLGVGTFGVHQARYALGYRDQAKEALATQGHGYLGPLATIFAGALVLVFAELVRRSARGDEASAPRFGRLWGGATLALVVVYAVQELVEGALAPGHPGGVVGVTGHGGWVALPLAAAAGLVIALLMRAAGAATQLGARRRPWRAPWPAAPAAHPLRSLRIAVRAGNVRAPAARGPPLRA